MILTMLIPVVMIVVTHTFVTDDGDVSGARTDINVEQERHTMDSKKSEKNVIPTTEEEVDDFSDSTTVESGHESTSASISNGESSVSISIDNSSSDTTDVPENSTQLSDYQYPGSTVASSTEGELRLVTSDGAEQVTNWYEDQIQKRGMNTQSFVRTNTNGKVLNKLGAAGNGEEVMIEISAENESGNTQIVVSR